MNFEYPVCITIKDYNSSGSFNSKDNRTNEENELLRLHKENKQLLMENDICRKNKFH